MASFHALLESYQSGGGLLLALLTVWATLSLGTAWIVAGCLRRASPAVRYCVWQFALLGLLLVPILFVFLPGIPLGFSLPVADPIAETGSLPPVIESVVEPTPAPLPERETVASDQIFDRDPAPSEAQPVETVALSAPEASVAAPQTLSIEVPPVVEATAADSGRSWPAVLLAVWGIGSVLQVGGLLVSAFFAWRLLLAARPVVESRFQRALDDLRSRLALTRAVGLLQTDQIQVPIVVGALRPRILLPADCGGWTPRRVWMVLVHELAHVERRDLLWQFLARSVAAIYWFHPLVWLALRRMRLECERACDDRVLLTGMEPTEYATGLVECAAAQRGRPLRLTLGIAMAQQSQLESRVRSILDASLVRGPASARVRRGIVLVTTCLVLALGLVRPFSPLAGGAPQGDLVAKESSDPATTTPSVFDELGNQSTRGKLPVLVTDAEGKPLAGVKVDAGIWTREEGSPSSLSHHYQTDAHGQVTVQLPRTLYILRLYFEGDHYVPRFEHWDSEPLVSRKQVPEEFTIALTRGTVLGGIVVDEEGRPVAGAKLQVSWNGEQIVFQRDHLITDDAGRWSIDTAPPDDGELRVIATHPDFISFYAYYDHRHVKPLPIDELRAKTARTVMERGTNITGTLTDPDGKPVAGALAIYGDRPYFEHRPQQEVVSDEAGVYRLPPLPPGKQRLTIVAPGWAPEMRQVEVGPELARQDFQLKPGKTLRVKVVDADGRPVPKAQFQVNRWRGANSLYNYQHSNVLESHVPRNADENGLYEWTWAPDDVVQFIVSAGDDFARPQPDFTADGQEHPFTLPAMLRIRGTVVDAATGRPIERFNTVPVEEVSELNAITIRDKEREQKGGKYLLDDELDSSDRAYRVRVEAPGYRSAVSEAFRIGQRDTVADFRLQKAQDVRGRLIDAQGNAVTGANVFLASKTQELTGPAGGEENDQYGNFRIVSGPQGEFTFPAQTERFTILVRGESGYAEADFQPDQNPGTIQLKDYARIAGRLWQAGKPVPNADIELRSIRAEQADSGGINDAKNVQTDENGNFVFEHVPPRPCTVWAELSPWKDYPITSSEYVPLDLQPGEQLTLELGRGGAAVSGRVAIVPAASPVDYHWALTYLLRMAPGITPPAGIGGAEFDWRRGWNDAWTGTPEGKAYLWTLHHDYIRLNPDGSFLINSLPAGDYELATRIYPHADGRTCLGGPGASRLFKFHVSQTDATSGALDLGQIDVEPAVDLQPGDAIGDFAFETLAGGQQKLSEIEGEYVLLDFWATWCVNCRAALPDLTQLAKKYQTDKRLAVVSLSLDSDRQTFEQFAEKHPLPGAAGFVGDWTNSPIPTRLGISSLPTYLLLGPDRKLVLQAWSLAQVSKKLDELENKKQASDRSDAQAPAATPSTIEIQGTVDTAQAVLIAGARVWAQLPSGVVETKTDDQGRFVLSVPQDTADGLLILASDGTSRVGSASWTNPRPQASPRIELREARALKVSVTGDDGQPVAGARVGTVIFDRSMGTGDFLPATTNEQGIATLLIPPEVKCLAVYARKPGLGFDYHSYTNMLDLTGRPAAAKEPPRSRDLPADGRIALVFGPTQQVIIEARETDGKPIVGLKLRPVLLHKPRELDYFNSALAPGLFEAETDAKGVATFDDLPSWEQGPLVIAHIGTRFMGPTTRVTLDPTRQPTGTAVAVFSGPVPVSGQVEFANGRPVPPPIEVEAAGIGFTRGAEPQPRAMTGSDGSFKMDLAPNQLYIINVKTDSERPRGRQWVASPIEGILVRGGKPVEGLKLMLRRPTVVKGRVTIAADKRPLPGQSVTVRQLGRAWSDLPRAELTAWEAINAEGAKTAGKTLRPTLSQTSTTAADGEYKFLLGPGDYELMGPSQTEPARFRITDQRELTFDIEALVPEHEPLVGKVVDAGSGQRIGGAKVACIYRYQLADHDLKLVADSDGTFRRDREQHQALVYARSPDDQLAGLVELGRDDVAANISVQPLGAALGQIIDEATGQPLANCRVHWELRIPLGDSGELWRPLDLGSTTTDKDGNFVIKRLIVGGQYHIDALPDGRPAQDVATVQLDTPETRQLGPLVVKKP